MKPCRKCGAWQPFDDFHRDRNKKDGRSSLCKACSTEHVKQYYGANKSKIQAYTKAYHSDPVNRLKMKAKRYGTTLANLLSMMVAQDEKCAACRAPFDPNNTKGVHIDHDHRCCAGARSCGRCIRGLLCASCNHALGNVRDDPVRLQQLIDYVSPLRVLNER